MQASKPLLDIVLNTAFERLRSTVGSGQVLGSTARKRESLLVTALCVCVLGDADAAGSPSWPPISVAELALQAGMPLQSDEHDESSQETILLIRRGLAAVDQEARRDSHRYFNELPRENQLLLLSRLEQGQLPVSRLCGSQFLDCFLTLAARAYLGSLVPEGAARPTRPAPQSDRHPIPTDTTEVSDHVAMVGRRASFSDESIVAEVAQSSRAPPPTAGRT